MPAAVVFDVGETLVDESRVWGELADASGVERWSFFAVLGAIIERRGHHQDVLGALGIEAPPASPGFAPSDLFDDAVPCVTALRRSGIRVGVAGNTSAEFERLVVDAGIEADFVASSQRWGVEKPAPGFFAHLADAAGCDPSEIVYVGDRIDNDVVPAAEAGMGAVFVLRGPWAYVQRSWPEAARATFTVTTLAEVPDLLGA